MFELKCQKYEENPTSSNHGSEWFLMRVGRHSCIHVESLFFLNKPLVSHNCISKCHCPFLGGRSLSLSVCWCCKLCIQISGDGTLDVFQVKHLYQRQYSWFSHWRYLELSLTTMRRREGWCSLCECEVREGRCKTTVTTSQHQTWGFRGCPVPTTSDITKSILEQSQFTVESWEE